MKNDEGKIFDDVLEDIKYEFIDVVFIRVVECFLILFLVFELDGMLQFYGGNDENYIQDLQFVNSN